MFEFMTIRELYELMHASRMEIDSIEYVQLQGWIRTNRCSGKLGFIIRYENVTNEVCAKLASAMANGFNEIKIAASNKGITGIQIVQCSLFRSKCIFFIGCFIRHNIQIIT